MSFLPAPARPDVYRTQQLVWRASFDAARAARRTAARTPVDRARLADAAEKIDKAAFTRADLVEIVGAQLPVDSERTPRELVEAAVDKVGVTRGRPMSNHVAAQLMTLVL